MSGAIDISGRTYSGCYGGNIVNDADLIVVRISCPSYGESLKRKQIIFVCDESGSMVNTISSVRASLFAARDVLLRLIGNDISGMTVDEKDAIFTRECNASIITFSDEAYCKWESNAAEHAQGLDPSSLTFTAAVHSIASDLSTNMGDALLMALSKVIPGYATWIILLTDGISNKGPYQSISGYKDFMKRVPDNVKIVPLGYTTSFDPNILSILGQMVYLDTEESIAATFGGIIGEIVTCYGINAKITLPELDKEMLGPDELINPSGPEIIKMGVM